jgi:thiaminase
MLFLGKKVSRKLIKPIKLRIANKVSHPFVKSLYDKTLTPAENLKNIGFQSDANNLEELHPNHPNLKYNAFIGFAETSKKKKKVHLDDIQIQYAKACISKYSLDYDAMSKDMIVNYNQMTAAKLKKLCSSYLLLSNES